MNKGDFKRPVPFRYSVTDNSYMLGFRQQYSDGKVVSTESGSFPEEAVAFVPTDNLVAIARNQALERLSEKARGSLNLAASIGESGQTRKMLNLSARATSNFSSMQKAWDRKIYERLRTIRNRTKLQKILKRWEKDKLLRLPLARKYYRRAVIDDGFVSRVTALGANGWLEFTYGWSPLIGDIKSVADNVVGRCHGLSNRITATGNVVINERRVSAPTPSYPSLSETAVGRVSVRVVCQMRPDFDPGLSIWTTFNPVSLAYELSPYSFVIDWAFNLGSYLRSLETGLLFQTQYQYGCVSTLSRVEYTAVKRGRVQGDPRNATRFYMTAKKVVTSFTRDLSPSYPIPSFPKVDVNLGSSRLLSAASLLRQLIR